MVKMRKIGSEVNRVRPLRGQTLFIITALVILAALAGAFAADEPSELAGRIFLKLEMPERKFYINEKVPIALHLYSDWLDLENIEVSGISSGDLVVGEFKKGKTEIKQSGQTRFAVLTYDSFLMAPSSGEFELAPVSVSFYIAKVRRTQGAPEPEMLNENEIFYDRITGSSERVFRRLNTDPVRIEIMPLPERDVPPGFSGAIGSFDIEASSSPLKVMAGEAITVKAVITGTGNFSAIKSLGLEGSDLLKEYEPKLTPGENKLIIEQVLRPLSSDVTEVPAVGISFFDPEKGAYLTVKKGPFPVKVEGTLKKEEGAFRMPFSAGEAPKREKALSVINIKESFGAAQSMDDLYFWKASPFKLVLAIPPVVLLAGIIVRRRIHLLETNVEYARQLRSSKIAAREFPRLEAMAAKGNYRDFYDRLFVFIREYLGARFGVAPQSLTGVNIGPILAERAVDPSVAEKIKKVFSDCYLARFTACEMTKDDMSFAVSAVRGVIKS